MKINVIAGALAAGMVLASGAGMAQSENGIGTTGAGKTTCLWAQQVDHTKYVAPQEVRFYLKDGTVWQNTLKGPCPGLNFNGFTMVLQNGQVCANAHAIRVLKSNEVCVLGDFSRVQSGNGAPAYP